MKIYFYLFISIFTINSLIAQRDKDEVDPLFQSAFKKYEEKDYSGSYLEYSNYLAKKPKDGAAYYNRGLCAFELLDYKDGITNYTKSISLGRKKADAFYSRGLCNYYLENYTLAIADFDTAISLKTNYAIS